MGNVGCSNQGQGGSNGRLGYTLASWWLRVSDGLSFKWPIARKHQHPWVISRVFNTNSAMSHLIVTWLILPVVICLSQRLSHACLSINNFILWNCEWLIKSVIVYLIVPYYLDTRSNSRANTCNKSRLQEGMYLLDKKPAWATRHLVIHDNLSNRMTKVGDGSFKFLPYQLSMVG